MTSGRDARIFGLRDELPYGLKVFYQTLTNLILLIGMRQNFILPQLPDRPGSASPPETSTPHHLPAYNGTNSSGSILDGDTERLGHARAVGRVNLIEMGQLPLDNDFGNARHRLGDIGE